MARRGQPEEVVEEQAPTVRGPGGYAGPGSLGRDRVGAEALRPVVHSAPPGPRAYQRSSSAPGRNTKKLAWEASSRRRFGWEANFLPYLRRSLEETGRAGRRAGGAQRAGAGSARGGATRRSDARSRTAAPRTRPARSRRRPLPAPTSPIHVMRSPALRAACLDRGAAVLRRREEELEVLAGRGGELGRDRVRSRRATASTPGVSGRSASRTSIATSLARARCPASVATPSLRSIAADAPAAASARPSASRGSGRR